MDEIFEIITEVLLEGIIEICSNKKISKWIRYPLATVIILFYLAFTIMLLVIAIKDFEENPVFSIIILAIVVLLIIGLIYLLKKLNIINYKINFK